MNTLYQFIYNYLIINKNCYIIIYGSGKVGISVYKELSKKLIMLFILLMIIENCRSKIN